MTSSYGIKYDFLKDMIVQMSTQGVKNIWTLWLWTLRVLHFSRAGRYLSSSVKQLFKDLSLPVCVKLSVGHTDSVITNLALSFSSEVVLLSHIHQFNEVTGQRSSYMTCRETSITSSCHHIQVCVEDPADNDWLEDIMTEKHRRQSVTVMQKQATGGRACHAVPQWM